MAGPNEQQLVAAAMAGDQAALGQLLERYQTRLFNVCLRMLGNRDDAAEICQDAMLKVIEHVGDYRGQSAISTWMIRIAMNLSLSKLRKRAVRQAASLEVARAGHEDQSSALRNQLTDHREPAAEQRVEQREAVAQLYVAMDRIEADFRAVLVLRDIDQMDYQQIADVLAIPIGTVKSRLFRARLALRQQLLGMPRTRTTAAEGSGHE